MRPGLHLSPPAIDADWRWQNFTPAELACKCAGRFCAGEYFHDPDFLDALQALRDAMGVPFHITSGRRCARWNEHEKGAKDSMHKERIAVDISLANIKHRHLLAARAKTVGFTGFGYAASFLHVDMRPKPAFWYYGRASRVAWAPTS